MTTYKHHLPTALVYGAHNANTRHCIYDIPNTTFLGKTFLDNIHPSIFQTELSTYVFRLFVLPLHPFRRIWQTESPSNGESPRLVWYVLKAAKSNSNNKPPNLSLLSFISHIKPYLLTCLGHFDLKIKQKKSKFCLKIE